MPGSSVLCCVTSPHPAAVAALSAWAPHTEVVAVTGEDRGYWEAVRARWTGERDLITVEQDIEVGEDTIASLEGCDQDWCSFAYPVFARGIRLKTGLGCAKFSAALQRKVPADQIAATFPSCPTCHGQGVWQHLDWHVAAVLKQAGLEPCVHGDIPHLHEYPVQSFLYPTHMDGRPVEEVLGDDRPPRDIPPIGPFTVPGARQFAAEMLAYGADVIAEQDRRGQVRGEENLPPPSSDFTLPGDGGFLETYRRYPYHTDKVAQGYMPAYLDIAADLGPAARVCELGVFSGGSLAAWQQIFPRGLVAGVDINPGAGWPDGTIRIVASQDDPALPALLAGYSPEWDLIVDDASHDGTLTAAALDHLWPLVAPGGFYVIEDWFVGFADYTGACKSPAMLGVARGLLERLRPGTDTEWVSYRYGMAVIRKKDQ
jgi:Methyltransferase domain